MIKLSLNGRQIEAPEGGNLLQVAMEHGVYIPHLCFHPGLSAPAGCRLCLVEVESGNGRKLVTACNTRVADGMVIDTQTETVEKARAAVMEFLLINHPLDCPVCAKAGECELQDHAHASGRDRGRFDEEKMRRKRKDIGAHLLLYAERCIGCTRCVRFCDEITNSGELALFHRGARTEVDIFPGLGLNNGMAGNSVDLCPTGALVDKDSHFGPPVWALRGVDSVCPGCSAGCNVRVDVHAGRIQRLKPRVNLEVNQYWMCDEGRYGWGYVHDHRRLSTPLVKEEGGLTPVSWEGAVESASQKLTQYYEPESLAAICGGHLTNEESYLFVRLVQEGWRMQQVCLQVKEDEGGDVRFFGGFTTRAEKAPNARGMRELAAALGLELREPEQLWQGMEEGRIRAAYVLGGYPGEALSDRERQALSQLEFLVVEAMTESELTAMADVLLPGVSFAEKEGTFTNVDGRVQRIRQAIPPRGKALPDWQILQRLGIAAGLAWDYAHPERIMEEIGQQGEGVFTGLTYEILEAQASDRDRGGQAYGGGWAAEVQRQGFIHVEDHTKSS